MYVCMEAFSCVCSLSCVSIRISILFFRIDRIPAMSEEIKRQQLATVNEKLSTDPNNPALKTLATSLEELIQLTCSGAVQQKKKKKKEVILPPAPPPTTLKTATSGPAAVWSKGQRVFARYKDKYHPAVIEDVSVNGAGVLEYCCFFDYGTRYNLGSEDITDQMPAESLVPAAAAKKSGGVKKASAVVGRSKPVVPVIAAVERKRAAEPVVEKKAEKPKKKKAKREEVVEPEKASSWQKFQAKGLRTKRK
jgi:hypothetical protein